MSDSEESSICNDYEGDDLKDPCSSSNADDDDHHDSDFIVHGGVEDADPLCSKLNDLIRMSLVDKSDILYKYLHEVIRYHFDQFHQYDQR